MLAVQRRVEIYPTVMSQTVVFLKPYLCGPLLLQVKEFRGKSVLYSEVVSVIAAISYGAYKTKVIFSGNGDISRSRAVNKKVIANTKQMLWLSESFTFCMASANQGSTLTKSFLSCFSSPL